MQAFQDWVSAYGGFDKTAARIGVSPLSVRFWFYRRGRPKTENILKILEISKGKLTFEEIIKSTQPQNKRGGANAVRG